MMHEPAKEKTVQRMCIVCRKIESVKTLLRFVCSPQDVLAFDVRGKLLGRGAFTCAEISCIERACEKGFFSRAFQKSIKVDKTSLVAEVVALLEKAILSNMGLAYRQGLCLPGRDQAYLALEKNEVEGMLLAEDLSERSQEEVADKLSHYLSVRSWRLLDMKRLGSALGRSETGVVALLKGRIMDRLIGDIDRYLGILRRSVANGQSPRA